MFLFEAKRFCPVGTLTRQLALTQGASRNLPRFIHDPIRVNLIASYAVIE